MKNRSRLIAPEFWESDSVNDLTIRQRLLFLGLISNADDQGRLKGRAEFIRSKVFIYDPIDPGAIQADLDAIAAIHGIILYEDSGRRYVQVVKWWSFQHPTWSQPSDLPAPEGWVDRWHYRIGNKVASRNWPKTEDSEPEAERAGLKVRPERPQGEATTKLPDNYNNNSNSNSKDKDAGASVPSTFPEWQKRLNTEKNQVGVIMEMCNVLYPDNEKPTGGQIGRGIKTHDAGYLLHLLWQQSSRPPAGNPWKFVMAIAKRGKERNPTEPAGFAGLREWAEEKGIAPDD